jgi:hypothetical protein
LAVAECIVLFAYLALTSNLDIVRNCEFAPLVGALTDRVARASG